jgi:ribosome-binding protein aMBF1 (putative translation factor)
MEQDWTPVVVRKIKTRVEQIRSGEVQAVKKIETKTNTQTHSDINLRKLDEADNIVKLPEISRDLANAIRDARLIKKLTQDQLNKQCGFPINTVGNYEKCIGLPNSQYINMLSRKLGVQLKNTKKD